MRDHQLSILVICLGNICRSPTAEAVLRAKLDAAGLAGQVVVDSAGTGDWHIGHPPDVRSQRHAAQRGYDLSALRARRVAEEDFRQFDLILAMDEDNLADLQRLAPDQGARAELRLFAHVEVPDPYQGGPAAFERVIDLVEAASDVWVENLARRLGTS
ncbi:MAG: low molecular weight phosphotyrosine protein phosphatase [Aquincola sp.]|nr:low molecular weight phosphotyrosine protein phosphatase [Aquincola sp.]MDH4289618.1 low molecular weight phosphotyrosine protein phosphatase [Aquincola sp.]MDH5328763.1 low molecular weight phosphotyrosine protein phosphatase [Aquincola sp.]